MAIADAGITIEQIEAEGERVGVVIGTSLGAHEMAETSTFKYKTSGLSKTESAVTHQLLAKYASTLM